MLIDKGFTEVRPLTGGFDAWVDAGYPTEVCGSEQERSESDTADAVTH
jgi:3-mercaptopyruvate sulfurtransferase SseA